MGQQQIWENAAGGFYPGDGGKRAYHSHGLLRDKGGGALLLQIEEGYPIVSYEYQPFLRTAEKSDVLQELRNHLGVAEVCPENIMLEITESGYIETDPAFRKAMEEICGQKLRLAIDDFGTGYSNLRYLKDLRADMIKIDRSFAVRALESDYDYTLLGHIIEMAHSIGLRVCLEGVETEEELVRLQRLSPDYIQGFLFGRPVPEREFVEKYLGSGAYKTWQEQAGPGEGGKRTRGETE